uniref:Uncharacterized protein n=1 Tax=Rhizophora mucronata TaxID=61149 RepID=A0A2P2NKD9_RHIMU
MQFCTMAGFFMFWL